MLFLGPASTKSFPSLGIHDMEVVWHTEEGLVRCGVLAEHGKDHVGKFTYKQRGEKREGQ